jgi:hypothetical protein
VNDRDASSSTTGNELLFPTPRWLSSLHDSLRTLRRCEGAKHVS